ncbi:hypothetical protein [Pseudonocardia abyssalis]|uniref:hypothetical protein n=1 Tax=Pseudonocardia abyssalis TaxID=2792008 RepID=UPI001C4A24C0|nr:hypothetical protein [Pseudonocardia abyssalis]MBW0117030.1 hypothetical protein [Pseudonocardia abyssalis]
MFTAQFVERFYAETIYVPSTSFDLSLLLCFQTVGSSAVASYGATTWPTEITITDVGSDTGNVGVSI